MKVVCGAAKSALRQTITVPLAKALRTPVLNSGIALPICRIETTGRYVGHGRSRDEAAQARCYSHLPKRARMRAAYSHYFVAPINHQLEIAEFVFADGFDAVQIHDRAAMHTLKYCRISASESASPASMKKA